MHTKEISIYIHWPFCESKCPYCDFNSHVRDKISHELFLSAYLKEIDFYKALIWKKRIASVFFGGGTPSLARPEMFAKILMHINDIGIIDASTEITIEANPSSSEASKFFDLAAAGINRISIGIQSFNDKELKFLGRKHSSFQALKAIENANKAFTNYSIDIIYALPWHTPDSWEQSLCKIMQYAGKHISLYQLTIEKGTKFFKDYNDKKFSLPNDNVSVELYELTNKFLIDYGYQRYEVSNHAIPSFECRHNLAYWRYNDYIGIGPGAHGRVSINDKKFAIINFHSPEKWLSLVTEGCSPSQTKEELSLAHQNQEKVIMGLRTNEGVRTEDLNENGINAKVNQLSERGLLKKHNERIFITNKGIVLLNSILSEIYN